AKRHRMGVATVLGLTDLCGSPKPPYMPGRPIGSRYMVSKRHAPLVGFLECDEVERRTSTGRGHIPGLLGRAPLDETNEGGASLRRIAVFPRLPKGLRPGEFRRDRAIQDGGDPAAEAVERTGRRGVRHP